MTFTAAPTASSGTMRDRVPGQALIERMLLQQAAGRPRSGVERLVGRDPLEPAARRWYAGATGERVVAARLSTLPSGWTVLHSLPVGRSGADIDHLVIGPAGVFTISTTHHVDASIWVAGRTVVVSGGRSQMIVKAETEAHRVDRIVTRVLADPPAVQPIVAVVGAKRLSVRGAPRVVQVLRAEHLRRFLRAQPERLTTAQVTTLVAVLSATETWQPAAEAGPELLFAYGRLAAEVRAAARVRLAWAFGLVGLTGAASAAIVLPGLLGLLTGF